jgi:hypothetical protein
MALRCLASWGRAPSRPICVARPSWPWPHGRDARATAWLTGGKGAGNLRMRRQESRVEARRSDHGRDARATAATVRRLKKRVSKFEEQSHYVIEKTGSAKKQSQNKPKLLPGNGSQKGGRAKPDMATPSRRQIKLTLCLPQGVLCYADRYRPEPDAQQEDARYLPTCDVVRMLFPI